MSKIEYRAVIRFLFLKKKSNDEIKNELIEVYGESAPSISTIKYWTAEYRRGRTSIFDEDRPGRPREVTTRIKLREIAKALNISRERVGNVLHEYLNMSKLSSRWVPRLLSAEHKRNRLVIAKESLALLNANKNEFLRRFVTVDETWIHHHTPESKEQSKQWISTGETAPKKAKIGLSANKVMATVFWDARGVIHVDYLEKGRTINGEYYSNLLGQFDSELKKKRPHMAKKKVLFHQDNAPAHKSVVAMMKLCELHYEILPHPPYSPDLAPCDYYLFPNLKKWLGGKKFQSNEQVICETNAYFEDLDQSYFMEGIKKLEDRWTKCIRLKGDYVEK